MPLITPDQFSIAEARLKSLSHGQWMKLSDELFVEQRLIFLELLSFGRDGATNDQTMGMIGFLSVVQSLAKEVSPDCAKPIEEAEFTEGVKRAYLFFQATGSEDPDEENRLHRLWFESVQTSGEPILWVGCWQLMQQTQMIDSPLAQGMAVTLFALVDCYSLRLGKYSEG